MSLRIQPSAPDSIKENQSKDGASKVQKLDTKDQKGQSRTDKILAFIEKAFGRYPHRQFR
jgi:hypothetical protein